MGSAPRLGHHRCRCSLQPWSPQQRVEIFQLRKPEPGWDRLPIPSFLMDSPIWGAWGVGKALSPCWLTYSIYCRFRTDPKTGQREGPHTALQKLKCAASIKQSLEEEARSGPGRRGSLFKCKKTLKHANLGGRREAFSAGGSPWGLKAPLHPFPGTGQTPRCCHVGPSRAGGASALPRGHPPRPRPTGGVHSLTRW